MADPFIGEIRMFAGNFPPHGWSYCNGSILAISQNTALFQLIGTTYGGNGQTTFGLPDLRGRIPVHQGIGSMGTFALGQAAGQEVVSLTASQMPAHTHSIAAVSDSGNAPSPGAAVVLAASPSGHFSGSATALSSTMASGAISQTGGNQGHTNLMPYTAINYIIALQGIFPSRS